MAIGDPKVDYAWAIHVQNENRLLRLALRSAGGETVHDWEIGSTVVKRENAYQIHFKGGPHIWLNNRSRKVEVQLSIYDAAYQGAVSVVRCKSVTIKKDECFVLLNPMYLYHISHDSTRVRGNGMA